MKAVQELADSVVGLYSKNEYFEMTMHGAQAARTAPFDDGRPQDRQRDIARSTSKNVAKKTSGVGG